MRIYPSEQTIEYWTKNYFSDFDLFFVNEVPFKNEPVIITSKDAFKESSSFNIKINNQYEFWNLNDYNYVIQSSKGWFERLENDIQEYIIKEQRRVSNPLFINKELITINKWHQFSEELKIQFFKKRIDEYQDNIVSLDLKVILSDHLNSIINTFPFHQGSNCLSTVLFAVTKNSDILNQWIKEDSFINTIKLLDFNESSKSCHKGDIIIYFNKNSVIHAAYQVENGLFINKSGQTIFNPYKLITQIELENDWGIYEKHVYHQH
ncbi:hypothetical protein J5E42_08835 [Mammaliicoccus vitulinus]|uniref:hypothetical protein n=1 Tax=Mammaliicoccus vitulinus TaxID=71237 RepID=UPI001AACB38A|nr:hypothetical protein [Mammaliicoccus vitulinus]MBO3077625.1 hypothetical protein [Mammaliicoccus vitulinus]